MLRLPMADEPENTKESRPKVGDGASPKRSSRKDGEGSRADQTAEPATVTFPVAPPPRVGIGSEGNLRLTLSLVSAIFGVTFISWSAGKVACNLHPPQFQEFKPASLERLTNSAKDAALEFHHSLNVSDFDRAEKVGMPSAKAIVDEARTACDAACSAEKETRQRETTTRAIVLLQSHGRARVEVESFYQGKTIDAVYDVQRAGKSWRVLGKAPPEPTPAPATAGTPSPSGATSVGAPSPSSAVSTGAPLPSPSATAAPGPASSASSD